MLRYGGRKELDLTEQLNYNNEMASLCPSLPWSLLKFKSTESVILSKHLILCCPLLLLPSVFPSIRVPPNELALHLRRPKYWSQTDGTLALRSLHLPCASSYIRSWNCIISLTSREYNEPGIAVAMTQNNSLGHRKINYRPRPHNSEVSVLRFLPPWI